MGRPSQRRWRKRLSRHVRDCPYCVRSRGTLIPAEGLLGGLALVPLPLGVTAHLITGTVAGVESGAPVAHAGAVPHARPSTDGPVGAARVAGRLANWPVAAVTSGVLVLTGAAVWYGLTAQTGGSGTPRAHPRPASASVSSPAPTPSRTSAPPTTASLPPSENRSTTTPTVSAEPTPMSGLLGPHGLETAAQPGRYVAVRERRAVLVSAQDGASLGSQQLAFTVVPGLMGTGCYSFRHPSGDYLRHTGYQEGEVELGTNDGGARFRADATYCVRSGPVEGSKALFAFNSPHSYLRYGDDGRLLLDPQEDADTAYDSSRSFLFVTP
ncbi:AbfB domain-containing protein [Streptomyces sp. IBSNAI001]|uniref:AbfB domain-containing protein n=1 Tax=Streptomyces sp. IBSNAI001 TaxID=3457499 RepID=UPI003FD3DBCF